MARQHDVVGSPAGLPPSDHLGWGYRDQAEFHARAADYIADGLARNQCIVYLGAGNRDELRAELATFPGLTDAADVKVIPALEFYGVPTGTDIIDPEVAVAAWVATAESAIQQGYAGFRAVSDATCLAGRPEQRKALARFEFLVDQEMATRPASALCGYALESAGDGSELICLHPSVGGHRPPTFRLYPGSDADLTLAGEIDAACGQAFATALQRICPLIDSSTVVIDAENLEFISHRPLLAVESYARANDLHIVLRTSRRIPHRLAELLPLGNVRVEQPSEDSGESAGNAAAVVVTRGPNTGARFQLDRPVTGVGRHPNSDIYLDDATVSRQHAQFRREGELVRIVDLDSLNGTYVNGDKVAPVTTLVDGDEVQIGKFRLVFLAGPQSLDTDADTMAIEKCDR